MATPPPPTLGNLTDGHRRLFEVLARALEPGQLDELPGGHADLAGKTRVKGAGAHAGELAEALDRSATSGISSVGAVQHFAAPAAARDRAR